MFESRAQENVSTRKYVISEQFKTQCKEGLLRYVSHVMA